MVGKLIKYPVYARPELPDDARSRLLSRIFLAVTLTTALNSSDSLAQRDRGYILRRMGQGPRSPLLGYNHNVKYKGRIFHVQTEDSGPANPHLFTHLYFHGTILASKRHEYDAEAAQEAVRALMQGLHKAILKDLKQALYDDRLGSFFASKGEPLDLTETNLAAAAEEHRALDLDALPPATEEPPPIEPHTPIPTVTRPAVPGPGVYVQRGSAREKPFGTPTPEPLYPPPTAPSRSEPPPASMTQPPGGIRRSRERPITQPPSSPVLVQRTVVVGAGGSGGGGQPPIMPPAHRPRRPAQPIPYVVKEGSHPLVNQQRPHGSIPARATQFPPARQLVPSAAAANAPRTANPGQYRSTATSPVLIVDKSLDEVILEYLDQGETPRR